MTDTTAYRHPDLSVDQALGLFTHLAGDRAVAWSGGPGPGLQINPAA